METHEKYAWLGPIRMLVIAFIAFGYASTLPRGPETAEYLRMFGYDPSWYGISVIFMMSGWLAMRSLRRHGSALKFLASRLGRNMPLLAIFAASVPLIMFPLFGVAPEAGATRWGQHLSYFAKVVSCLDPSALTPGLLDNALYMCLIQGGIWTFRWGLIAFVAMAILWPTGLLKNKFVLLTTPVLLLASYIGSVTYGMSIQSEIMTFLSPGLRLGWAFMAGVAAYEFREKLSRSFVIPAGLLAATLAQYFLMPWTPMIEVTATLALGYLTMIAMTSNRVAPSWVRKLPDISLGLYIFNWPLSQILLLTVPTLTPLALFGASFSLTVLLSLGFWVLLNKPMTRKMDDVSGLSLA